jgi:hypothetical protein
VWTVPFSPAGWGLPDQPQVDHSRDAESSAIATDGDGPLFTVWTETDGTRFRVWSSRKTITGWSPPQELQAVAGVAAREVAIAAGPSGIMIAAWAEEYGTGYRIAAARFLPGMGWEAAVPLEDDAGQAHAPAIAVDERGDAIVVWLRTDGSRISVWGNRFLNGEGWGPATRLETDDRGDAEWLRLARDRGGGAIAVWRQSDGARLRVVANRFAAATGWRGDGVIQPDLTSDAGLPEVAVNAAGEAIAIWPQGDAIWSVRFR